VAPGPQVLPVPAIALALFVCVVVVQGGTFALYSMTSHFWELALGLKGYKVMGYGATGMCAFMGVQLSMHIFLWMMQGSCIFSGRDEDVDL
jgi:hypothetical protein